MENSNDLWPPADYYEQLEYLRAHVNQMMYVVEINETAINAGVKFSSTPLELVSIVDFSRPDPYKQLCPHILIFDDGRGINLGRIARITVNSPFTQVASDTLYLNQSFVNNVLNAPRQLSQAFVKATSNAILSQLFGGEAGLLLASIDEK